MPDPSNYEAVRDLAKGELTEAALCYVRLYIACVNPDSPNAAAPPTSVPTSWPFAADSYEPKAEPIDYLYRAHEMIDIEIRRHRAKQYAGALLAEMRKDEQP